MDQRIPVVSERDAWRVLGRDYAPDDITQLRAAIADLDATEKWRVVLACLENAAGSRERLRGMLEIAPGYWRDLISEAEYPRAMRLSNHLAQLAPAEQQKVFDEDWRQYESWLTRAS